MNIIVCIKQVPDTTDVEFNEESNTLIRTGLDSVVNPFDLYAIEEALRLREQYGGAVTVLSMGPPQVVAALREAMSMGADDAVLLSDIAFAGADTLATSRALAKGVERIGPFDLIVCGRQAIDGDTGQVGPELAEMLGLPYVSCVTRVQELTNGSMTAERIAEEGLERIRFSLPALMTVAKGINEPRFPSLKRKLRALRSEIPVWSPQDVSADVNKIGLKGSATRVSKMFAPRRRTTGQVLEGTVQEQVTALLAKLRETGLIARDTKL